MWNLNLNLYHCLFDELRTVANNYCFKYPKATMKILITLYYHIEEYKTLTPLTSQQFHIQLDDMVFLANKMDTCHLVLG